MEHRYLRELDCLRLICLQKNHFKKSAGGGYKQGRRAGPGWQAEKAGGSGQ